MNEKEELSVVEMIVSYSFAANHSKILTFVVNCFHAPDLYELTMFLIPSLTSPNSDGLGGTISTLAYFTIVGTLACIRLAVSADEE